MSWREATLCGPSSVHLAALCYVYSIGWVTPESKHTRCRRWKGLQGCPHLFWVPLNSTRIHFFVCNDMIVTNDACFANRFFNCPKESLYLTEMIKMRDWHYVYWVGLTEPPVLEPISEEYPELSWVWKWCIHRGGSLFSTSKRKEGKNFVFCLGFLKNICRSA